MRLGLALLMVCLTAVESFASDGAPVSVATRAKGATRVVVGVVTEVESRFDVNEAGDRLIFTTAWLRVDETLKGTVANALPVDIEGGTIGELTLKVSDMTPLRKGDRAVFFLTTTRNGKNVPHRRGLGILKLDRTGKVENKKTTLAEVRAMVRAAQR